MRLIFREYFRPTAEELAALWGDSLLAFDTSVLLNVYGYSKTTREEISNIFLKYKDRLVLPYQFAQEYSVGRSSVIVKQIDKCDLAIKGIDNLVSQHFEPKKSHPHLSQEAMAALEVVRADLAASRGELESLIGADPHADMILEAFAEGVGEAPDDVALQALQDEAKARYANKIPPGYKDADKDFPKSCGDFIGWSQLIEIANTKGKALILVTDDAKEDWWKLEGSRTISPRPELIREFFEKTGNRIWIYNSESFLRAAVEFGDLDISERSITEIQQTVEAREERLIINLSKHAPDSPKAVRTDYKEAYDLDAEVGGDDVTKASDKDEEK